MQEYVSNISHIGGLCCGLFPALVYLPKLKRRAPWEVVVYPVLGIACILSVFVALPVWIYQVRLVGLTSLC